MGERVHLPHLRLCNGEQDEDGGASYAMVVYSIVPFDDADAKVELARLEEREQFARSQLVVGSTTTVHFSELGASGVATVESIVENFEVPSGCGSLVRSTINSMSNDVYELSFVEGGDPLRGTGAHPVYSLDRDEWVRVRELQVGERLQTAEGAVTVEALEKVRGFHRVYKLEVEGDHEYLVGEAGVRAHNNKVRPGGGGGGRGGGGGGGGDGPFVPDEYWQRTAPTQVTPGTRRLDHRRVSGRTGRTEDSRVIYDEYIRSAAVPG